MESIYLLLLAIAGAHAVGWDVETPLDEYVHSDDGYFDYHVINEYDGGDHMVYVLNMTSQMWQDEELTTKPLWWHYLAIFVPDEARFPDSALLFVGSGYMGDDPPVPGSGRMARLANFTRNTGAVSAYLLMVPNQPTIFVHDPTIRVEDAIIAHTWKLLIEDPREDDELDRSLNLLFPMTKSAKRALDTIEEFVPTVHETIAPTQFMATGYSKRGWVTWLLGCVDQRMFAIAPTVFDLLGMYENLHHHHMSMGGWSWAFTPYRNEDVARYLNHPRVQTFIVQDIDAISYNERLTMPKMLILGGNDQFFPSTGSHYFFDELNEPKFMCLYENDDHGLGNHQDEIDRNLEAFFIAARTDDEGGAIILTGDVPTSIKGWVLDTTEKTCEPLRNNTCRRDTRFRAINGLTDNWWDEKAVEDTGDSYLLEFERRTDDRFRAFFMDVTYPGPDDLQLRFSTEVNVVPNTFPFPRCETEEECHGILV